MTLLRVHTIRRNRYMTDSTALTKDFEMPTSATSGINDYDQEGTKPKKRKKPSSAKRPAPKVTGKPAHPKSPKTQVQGQNGENVDYDDNADSTDTYEDDDAAYSGEYPDDTDDDDELEAMDDANNETGSADAFDTDPNSRYGKRSFSDKKRKKLADTGAAMPDGSFPIENTSDLKNAIQSHGRAKDPDKAKAHIKARAKALGAESELPDDWKKFDGDQMNKVDITKFDNDQLEKFFNAHRNTIVSGELVKGVYDVAGLGNLIAQLHSIVHNAYTERDIEGDDSKVPEELRDAAANLLSILGDMAAEESGEIKAGTTAEDVMNDYSGTPIAMVPGLYRSDVGTLAKALRTSLFGVEEADLAKAGARNSKKDLETLQKCHDALCELGASCASPSPHENDGEDVKPQETMKMAKVSKTDTVMSEGNKRGAAVTDPKMEPNSTNAEDAEDTSDQGQEKPQNDTKKSKARDAMAGKKKKRADMDMDEDDMDEDEDDMDEDEDEDFPPPKAKKKAKKFDEAEMAKMIATVVASTMAQVLGKADNGGTMIPRVAPNLMQVGKGGEVNKLQAVNVDELRKSVTKVQATACDPGDNDTATLIKAIHKGGATFRLNPNEIPQS